MILRQGLSKKKEEIIKDGVTHKTPLVMMSIVKLVVNQFSLNVKREKS